MKPRVELETLACMMGAAKSLESARWGIEMLSRFHEMVTLGAVVRPPGQPGVQFDVLARIASAAMTFRLAVLDEKHAHGDATEDDAKKLIDDTRRPL